MINYGSQYIDSNDIRAVTKVLKKKLITQGPQIDKFESFFNKQSKKSIKHSSWDTIETCSIIVVF